MQNKNIQHVNRWLLAIILIAIVLRLYGIDFGNPYNYHPDETKLIAQAGRLLETKFLDKDAYFGINVYPPFHTYILAGAMGLYIGFGLVTGRFESLAAVQAAYESEPFQFFLLSRILVLCMGVLSILIIYLIAKRLYSEKAGLIASLLVAVNFLHVRNSHFGTVDIPATLWGLLCIYFCVRIMQDGATRDYILAAIFAAVSMSTKFSAILIVIPLLFAHFTRSRRWLKLLFDKKLWMAAGAGILSFLVVCPLIWLDFNETWGGIIGTSRFEKVGKIGSGGGLLSYWTGDQSDGFGVFFPNSIPETFGLLLTLFAAAGLFLLLVKHRRQDIFLLACVVPMYLLFEKMSVKAMRHILPIIPFILLAATILLLEIGKKFRGRVARIAFFSVILGFISSSQIIAGISYHHALSKNDPRTSATEWMKQHVPKGSAVAIECFPPVFLTNESEYDIYETSWTSKTDAKRDDFLSFSANKDSLFYVADDFTRQIFQWKFTEEKYPAITADRFEFFQWLDDNMEKMATFDSRDPNIQPTITIYLIKDIDLMSTDLNKFPAKSKPDKSDSIDI